LKSGVRIDYKTLRKTNPAAARLAVVEYLSSNGNNISDAAEVFGINRCIIYKILRKKEAGDLSDAKRTPHTQPRKTQQAVEEKVIAVKNKTRLGPKRLSIYLKKYEQLVVPYGTIRHILRRNKEKLIYNTQQYHKTKEKRQFVDWYSAKPFEIVQIDLKQIRDQKALTHEQLVHLDKYHIPNYQWGALDVTSRFKLIGYSREKTWTSGLLWYLWVIAYLRSHGVTCEIVFTVDNGEEFGGKSWMKVKELRKLIAAFGCRLIQNHKGHCEENAHLERSHRTDDDEFYIPRVLQIKSEKDLLYEAHGYIYYYNNLREHSSLDYQAPFQYLTQQVPTINQHMKYAQPILLDTVSTKIGDWSGYNVLAQNRVTTVQGVFFFSKEVQCGYA
jgi:transposase